MQVFLPEADFDDAALNLDNKRLLKQLLEGRQIMTILVGESKSNAWRNHPAVKMFDGYPYALYTYLAAIRNEMQRRQYKWEKNWNEIERMSEGIINTGLPEWMLDDSAFYRVLTTHRGRLYEKAPDLYPQYRAEYETYQEYVCCPGKCTYYWPVTTHGYGE
jgi:hypothetical protein